MHGLDVLRDHGFGDAVFKPEDLLQLAFGHVLKATQHKLLLHVTSADLNFAELTLLQHQIIGRDRIPEVHPIQRFQPFFYILNIFKNNHGTSIPKCGQPKQFCTQ